MTFRNRSLLLELWNSVVVCYVVVVVDLHWPVNLLLATTHKGIVGSCIKLCFYTCDFRRFHAISGLT